MNVLISSMQPLIATGIYSKSFELQEQLYMHPKAQQYRIRPCVVCGYKFSDEHHIHAELLGRSISPTIILCPNHHRYAHILQVMVSRGEPFESMQKFSHNFDSAFNEIAGPLLLDVYRRLNSLIKLINLGIENIALQELDKYGVFSEVPEEKLYYFIAKELQIIEFYIPEMLKRLEKSYHDSISAEVSQMWKEDLFSWIIQD